MRIVDYMIKYLEKLNVKYVFGLPSATTAGFYDALVDSNIELFMFKNEAGAVFSAVKYAEMSKEIGVSILASSVGINNAINGISEAYVNKTPLLVITGNASRVKNQKGAMQNVNSVEIVKPITKYSKLIEDETSVMSELCKALKIALAPPFGPVHLSIPIDVQSLKVNIENFDSLNYHSYEMVNNTYDDDALNDAIKTINEEQMGIILYGRGAIDYVEKIKALSLKLNWPIIATPRGKGFIDEQFKLYMGNYGFAGTDETVRFVKENCATCVLVLGSALGECSILDMKDDLFKNKKIIHIDWDVRELNKIFKANNPVHHDLKLALPEILNKCEAKNNTISKPSKFNSPYIKNHTGVSVRQFSEKIMDFLPSKTIFVGDIGEYLLYIIKYLPIIDNVRLDVSINNACMGIGIGGVIGTHLALPEYQTAVIVGDGSFFMNGMEILVAKEHILPIIYFVINNSMLSLVENGHMGLYRRSLSNFKWKNISIAGIAKSMGLNSIIIEKIEDLDLLNQIQNGLDEPLIVEIVTDNSEKSPIKARLDTLRKSM